MASPDRETMARYWTYWYERHMQEAAQAKKYAESYGAVFNEEGPITPEACKNVPTSTTTTAK